METSFHIYFLIDSSSSMEPVATDVCEGFNEYITQLRDDVSHVYHINAALFDTVIRSLFTDLVPSSVPRLDETNYHPDGGTSIRDALGFSIESLTSALKTPNKPYGEDHILVILMTDGADSASKHFTETQIREAITIREKAGNWTFIYLGVDQVATTALGFATNNILSLSSAAIYDIFQGLAISTREFTRNTSPDSFSFVENITISLDDPDKL